MTRRESINTEHHCFLSLRCFPDVFVASMDASTTHLAPDHLLTFCF